VRAELVEAEYVPFDKLRAHLPPHFTIVTAVRKMIRSRMRVKEPSDERA
jgi:hypothetical protein